MCWAKDPLSVKAVFLGSFNLIDMLCDRIRHTPRRQKIREMHVSDIMIIADQQTSQRKSFKVIMGYGGRNDLSRYRWLIYWSTSDRTSRHNRTCRTNVDSRTSSTFTNTKANVANQSLIRISEIAGSRYFKDYEEILLVPSNITS